MCSQSANTRQSSVLGFSKPYFTFPKILGQNAWLDVLRAVAVLLVLFRHGERAVTSAGLDAITAHPFHTLFLNGWVGVDLFLVLSGYLIGKSLIKMLQRDDGIDVLAYLRARVLRILPAYYAVLFFTAAGLFPLYEVSGESLYLRVLYHLLFLQDYLPANINVVFWSLGVEEKFYILAPIIFFCLLKIRRPRIAVLFLLTLFLCSPIAKTVQFLLTGEDIDYPVFFQTYRSPFHLTLEPLIVGVAISYAEMSQFFCMRKAQAKRLFFLASLLMVIFLSSHDFMATFTLWDVTVQPTMIAVLFGGMVVSGNALKNVPVWMEMTWRALSRLSYSLYLVHYPLIPLAFALTISLSLPVIAFWGIFILLSLSAALALHFIVEKPFLILKERHRRARKIVNSTLT